MFSKGIRAADCATCGGRGCIADASGAEHDCPTCTAESAGAQVIYLPYTTPTGVEFHGLMQQDPPPTEAQRLEWWGPSTYAYISGGHGHAQRRLAVYDGVRQIGGQDPAAYVRNRYLPPFLDGTYARWGACHRCGFTTGVLHSPGLFGFGTLWQCVNCRPFQQLPVGR